MATLLQLMIIGVWGAALLIHTRRLLRLAALPIPARSRQMLRQKARRIWWWLGRDEFWQQTCADVARCLQLTLIVVALAYAP